MSKLKLLDLFSGIGGFSLGLERSGGFETVAFCELEDYPRRVLAKHWPEVPCYDDIRTLTAERLTADGIAVDAICGGFPCQDISIAGRGAGLGGERSGLWWEIFRLICDLRPGVVFLENVAELLARGIDTVLGALASIRYNAEWYVIPASYVGARSLRERVWIVAYPECVSVQGRAHIASAWEGQSRKEQLARLVQPCAWPTVSSARNCGTGHGIPNGSHRNKGIGNAVVPQIPELLGRAWMEANQ
jgi:DNA (cytosine-5)-methyltransferase 1